MIESGEIARRAAELRPGVVIANAFAGALYAVGWLAGRLWYGLCWSAVALAMGARAGGRPAPSQGRTAPLRAVPEPQATVVTTGETFAAPSVYTGTGRP